MSPYIPDAIRNFLENGWAGVTAGELNYQIAVMCDQYLCLNGVSYKTLAEVEAALQHVSKEIYRRITAPYEDGKLEENGEVFFCIPTEVS
jgi:hypothetical protein